MSNSSVDFEQSYRAQKNQVSFRIRQNCDKRVYGPPVDKVSEQIYRKCLCGTTNKRYIVSISSYCMLTELDD